MGHENENGEKGKKDDPSSKSNQPEKGMKVKREVKRRHIPPLISLQWHSAQWD